MINFFFYLTLGAFIFVCVVLILIILIQKGRGGGLASAFGGAGGNTAFGSKTGDVLTWATSVIFGVFILLAIALNLLSNHRGSKLSGLVTAPPPPIAQPGATVTIPDTAPPATLPVTK